MYLIKTPWLLKKLYPKNLIWNMPREQKIIYLTFDDGPIPDVTPWVLKTLENRQIKATFFCIGDNIQKHPQIFEELKKQGHAIGNHTFNHLKGWAVHDDVYLDNIKKCAAHTGVNLFRPPYGRIKRSQIKKLQKQHPKAKIVMWDVLSGDFDIALNPEKCLSNVIKHTTNGSIIVFHDSLKAKKRLLYTLPKAIDYWKQQGYIFKTL